MDKTIFPLFRPWVPEWLVKIILFILLLPSLVLFFLPLANLNAAAGYYGSEPADMQFAVVLFYAGYAGFYALEQRFFNYLATKEYFIIFTFSEIILALICYHTQVLYVLFPIRFIQGMFFASTVNLSLAMIFSRLHSERAREIGFSVFFGMLICTIPFNNLVTADIIDSFNFNIVYKCVVFSYLPGLFMLMISMNNVHLNVRFHMYQLDWESFFIYSTILCLIGYITVFGQQYYWLEDLRIRYSACGIAGLMLLYILRQRHSKRPYTDLAVFSSRNFILGLLLLFVLYICRFAAGITNTFFGSALKFDPIHISYINLFNLAGLITGVIVSCCMVLQKKPIRYMWLPGFGLLLVFHVMMFFLLAIQANENNYFLPLFMQGLGIGLVMVPTIVFVISSVPVSSGPSASALCLAVRFLGFCISIAMINYFELYEKSRHYNAFQDHLTKVNPVVRHTVQKHSADLLLKGIHHSRTLKASQKLLVGAVNEQSQIRFAMDYNELMVWMLAGVILLIALFPYLNRTAVYLKSSRLSPA